MATLTYDPSEAPPEGELTAEEQDSLQVGEQLEQAEQQMLAGKFKNAEDLEKAYIELQSKLGEPKEESEPEPEAPEPEANFLETLWEETQNKKGERSRSLRVGIREFMKERTCELMK